MAVSLALASAAIAVVGPVAPELTRTVAATSGDLIHALDHGPGPAGARAKRLLHLATDADRILTREQLRQYWRLLRNYRRRQAEGEWWHRPTRPEGRVQPGDMSPEELEVIDRNTRDFIDPDRPDLPDYDPFGDEPPGRAEDGPFERVFERIRRSRDAGRRATLEREARERDARRRAARERRIRAQQERARRYRRWWTRQWGKLPRPARTFVREVIRLILRLRGRG
jgi:hypothetical protein